MRIAEGIVNDTVAAGGILTLDDMRGYRPVWREPLRLDAMGLTVLARARPSLPLRGTLHLRSTEREALGVVSERLR